jgi:hypothetical protein
MVVSTTGHVITIGYQGGTNIRGLDIGQPYGPISGFNAKSQGGHTPSKSPPCEPPLLVNH